MRTRLLLAVAICAGLMASGGILAQPKYAGPWDPAAEAAAERAVARLGGKTSLDIRSTILTISEPAGP
jgi:hypothetical protein